jgi:1D-myo-inositol-tetrakisphosphate 5-kinase/inositol-polyphosphate multikinase
METTAPSFGLPASLLLIILESLREDVAELLKAFQEVHLRMVGGSLLIIYESDWERAAECIKLCGLEDESSDESHDDIEEDEAEDSDEDDGDDDDKEEDEAGKKRPGPPYTVNLIDFAHTRITPGQGPDQGVLLGLSTVRKLLDERIEQVRNAVV